MTIAGPGADTPDPDHVWKALSLVNDWVKHAETKSGATLAASGVAGGVLYSLVKNQSDPDMWLDLAAGVCGAAALVAGLLALAALTPQLSVKVSRGPRSAGSAARLSARHVVAETQGDPDDQHEGPAEDAEQPDLAAEDDPVNLLFFGDIARVYAGDSPTYTDVLLALTSDPAHLTQHIARQVHANALVARRKYRLANYAIRSLGVALVLLALTTLLVGAR